MSLKLTSINREDILLNSKISLGSLYFLYFLGTCMNWLRRIRKALKCVLQDIWKRHRINGNVETNIGSN
jgi:hypothetical protein